MPEKKSKYRWFVMGLLFILYTVANADRANIGFALPYLRKEFAMSNTEAGGIISLFFFAYAFFQVPSGFLVKKFGNRTMFTIGMLFTSIFTGMLGMVNSVFALKAFRFGVGIAEAPVAIASSSTINNWFPPKEKGTATGIFLAGSKFGPLIVPVLCAWIISVWGWREIFIFSMIPGLILAVIWFFLVANRPSESKFVNAAEVEYIADKTVETQKEEKPKRIYKLWWVDKIVRAKKVELLSTPSQVFRCWDMWGVACGYFFAVGLSSVFMSWLPTYLVTVKHFAIMKTAFVASAPFAGTVVGNFFGGWFSDNVLGKRRKPMMMITAISTSIMMYSMLNAPEDPILLGILLFCAGVLLALGYSMYMAYGMGRANKETYPVAFSLVNTGGQLGGACMPLVVGIILDTFNWDAVWMALALGSVICLAIISSVVEPVEDPVEKPSVTHKTA
ncbi:MFS transporter [uncultured Anaeromusa sp.]|uniref:MFS transporter n=1 Tax=uncultured Anaeromusa sp. TaxID=673273 RepID=UPI0029C8004F|nr:MFS transporter [uncultured Anaeromusa sp.]